MSPEPAVARASAIQRYRFVGRLASGGMAEVYVADAIGVAGVKKRVALKRILPSLASDRAFVTMFLNEARIASTLQHPNIVQTYDVIDDRGEYYIAMELLEGVTLLEMRQRLYRQQRAPTAGQVLYIVDRVLAGLHYAHERKSVEDRPMQVVHRDVSPHNVFLTMDGSVKLLDFGVAKVEAVFGGETESGVVKGKVLYMAPEQCQGLDVDRTADIFAAGALMYVLLTGQHPFRGSNPYDTMRAIIHDTPTPPSSITPQLGTPIDQIVAKAMAKSPADRYASAREMQRAIANVVRERGWFLNDLDFAAFVESVLGADPPSELDTRNLPPDLVIGDRVEEEITAPVGRAVSEAAVAETEHALVERVRGLTVLTLRGVIDERFDSSIANHLRGVMLVDTEDVTRITSYGIRALLKLIEASASQIDAVYHIRCSVTFIQQVNMIPRLLGGGQIVSFYLPYVDPLTQQPLLHLLWGPQAALVLRSHNPPRVPCPGPGDRTAEFDEDAESFLDFADDFCAHPPVHVISVIEALANKEKRRQVEKEITPSGAVLYIRRPLDEGFRWKSLLAGVEGKIRIDFDATPTWTGAGLQRLVSALEQEVQGVSSLELLHMPLELYRMLERYPKLKSLVRSGSVRVHGYCTFCEAPRRVAVDLAAIDTTKQRKGRRPREARCPACNREVIIEGSGSQPGKDPRPVAAEKPPKKRRIWWALALFTLMLLAVLLILLLALLQFGYA
jgi:serine/threonine protein kinase